MLFFIFHFDSHRYRVIIVFQELEGADVALFMLCVHEEIDEDGRDAKTEIEYIDSVKYFEPSTWRRPLYKEIVIGYLDYARKIG